MAIGMKEIRAILDPDEVDYSKARKLGKDAIPFIMELVQGGDLGLASKAACLASFMSSDLGVGVLEKAASSKEAVVRVAAASGLRNLSETRAKKLVELMYHDSDSGVRKVVLKSVSAFKSARLVAMARELAENDPEPFVRELAASTVKKMKLKTK